MSTITPALRGLLASLAGAVAFASAAADVPLARLNTAQSQIAFTAKQMGVPVDGEFKRFDAKIALDPKHPETGRVSLSIQTGSATMGSAETDVELPKPAWFSVASFPQALFQSETIKPLGNGKLEVRGKLSLKGQTRDLVVPVVLATQGNTSTATGSFALKRLDFRIGDGEWADVSMVANDVQVKFKLVFNP